MPKWLFDLRARVLDPAPDSSRPCASVMLAGIPYLRCCSDASLQYFCMYASYKALLRICAVACGIAEAMIQHSAMMICPIRFNLMSVFFMEV